MRHSRLLGGFGRRQDGPTHHDAGRSASRRGAVAHTGGEGGALFAELSQALSGEVRFERGDRALYATDASNYRQVPTGVVVPRSADDVRRCVEICRRHDVPITARGGGTSLVGQATNTAVVIDFSKYLSRILALDPEARTATVEPGCVLDALRDAAEVHGLTFGPDPSTHDHNTLGGMIGNNSCGVHSVAYGRTADNVLGLRILTYRGLELQVGPTSNQEFQRILAAGGERAEIYRKLEAFRDRYGALIRDRFPVLPRRVSGFADLDKLLPEHGFDVAKALVGTEGTCVTVLEAELSLAPSPKERVLLILGFRGIDKAADAVPEVLEFGPRAIEGIDAILVEDMQRQDLHTAKLEILPEGHDWLVVEFGGDTLEEAEGKGARLARHFAANPHVHARLVKDPETQEKVWRVREAGLPATAYVPDRPEAWEGWEDTAVPRERLGDYLRALRALYAKYGYESPMYGHFGDGLVHCRVSFDLKSEPGIEQWRRFLDEAADLVVRHGGSLSGEHGDGQGRAELLEKMYGAELVQAFGEFKAIWDPDGRMNPGKVVDPNPITSNLRLGPSYQPPKLETHFAFGEDSGFAGAMERCVGVGKCRRSDPGTQIMCPSYQVTMEEKHSTRGRARLLFEMLHGGAIEAGWKSDAVEEALDLCLSCKGCKSDCPVNVDMATYKAEFRSHYYAGRLRPRAAYSMGLIYWWSRVAGNVPWAANLILHGRGLASATKWAGGVAQERELPRYADQSFTSWFRQRRRSQGNGRRVVLWPDTFNNFFRPETAIAAVHSLEALGWQVSIPRRRLCCGRPLYDWGMLSAAKRLWQQTFGALEQEIEAGTPIVGLEPACVAAFKEELPGLFPTDPRAERLSAQVHYFSDFVAGQLPDRLSPPRQEAVVHFHCNHHAIIGRQGECDLLRALGVRLHVLPSGCCGMAGSFGLESGKYDLSMQLAERALLPAVRKASEEQLIVASGYSCREQIEQGSSKRTLHAAEVTARRLGTTNGAGDSR